MWIWKTTWLHTRAVDHSLSTPPDPPTPTFTSHLSPKRREKKWGKDLDFNKIMWLAAYMPEAGYGNIWFAYTRLTLLGKFCWQTPAL